MVLPGLACLVLAALPEGAQVWLAWQRDAITQGEIWRLWTAHLLHFGALHAMAGVIALLLFGFVLHHEERASWLVCLAVVAPLLSAALLLVAPGLGDYRGASGLIAASLAWLLMHRAAGGSRGALIAAAVLIVVISAESLGFALPASTLPDGINTVWQAHALGALLGLATFAAQRVRTGKHRPVFKTLACKPETNQYENARPTPNDRRLRV